jgi:hypothetical protein
MLQGHDAGVDVAGHGGREAAAAMAEIAGDEHGVTVGFLHGFFRFQTTCLAGQ